MPTESASYISQLNPASPTDASLKSEGDNEFRQIKTVLQTQFPNLATTPVTVTPNELNALANVAIPATGATALYAATQATIATGKALANLDTVDAKILAASLAATLPSQTGNAGKYVTTNGTTASWGAPPALVLLATLTPTVSANIDFLTTFTSGYDNYLIIGDGISVAVDDGMRIRLANAGVVDSGSNYYSVTAASSTPFTAALTTAQVTSTITSAGVGATFSIEVKNVNDAVKLKTIKVNAISQSAATPAFTSTYTDTAYTPASTVSGFRLYLASGNNFAATGRVRVYGINNS